MRSNMTHYVQGVGNVSDYERQMLDALVRNGKPSAPKTPAELIHDYPSTFGNRSPQGVHQTAASLVRKGLIYRLHDEAGHVCYEINYAGLSAIREIRR